MCFLGSKKYPGENDYKSYLAAHGGRSNASTSMHMTTYKFEVLAPHAEKALDMFLQFFVAPLFTESGTGREVNAVDSENSKNLTADGRRRLQIFKALCDPDHYYSKFSTGNAKTLPTEERLTYVRDALLAFHRKHYRPDNLTVCVAGPQSLDELQEWIMPVAEMPVPEFPASEEDMTEAERMVHSASADAPSVLKSELDKKVPDHNQAMRPGAWYGSDAAKNDEELKGHPASTWPYRYTIKPLRAMRKLNLMFPMPPVSHMPDDSPSSVLSHLLGHEGAGSPFALLQERSWISSLSAGSRVSGPDFSIFQIDMALTEEGEKNWEKIVDVIMQHCRLLKDAADKDSKELVRDWEESIALSKIFFDTASPSGVYDTVPGLSQCIVRYGTEQCLSAGRMLNESAETYPMEMLRDFVARLTPDNLVIERCSQDAWKEVEDKKDGEGIRWMKEPWYDLDFIVSSIDPETVKHWRGDPGPLVDASSLALPRPNRFIPRTLDLCDDLPDEAKQGPRIDKPIDPPNLLINDPATGRLWHRLDDRYALPKASLSFVVRNAATNHVKNDNGVWVKDTAASVHASILASMFYDSQAVNTYDADLAGLYWQLSCTQAGVKVSCSGFSDRLPDLANTILKQFYDPSGEFLQAHFLESARDQMLRSLRTYFESRRADSHAIYYRDFLMASVGQPLDVSIEETEKVTMESIKAYHKSLLENNETLIECFCTGNVSESTATKFFDESSSLVASVRDGEAVPMTWTPAGIERRIPPGTDYHLHFPSKNLQEENGATTITYQSSIPGFRGRELSTQESLESTAAIRVLSTIIREPCFDELRTKQTLGYIVSSYYDLGFSSPLPAGTFTPHFSVPVDFLVFNVLSKKLPPTEVAERIDEFLVTFRKQLDAMPESEIETYTNSLSTKLLKPFQKLSSEASNQFGKIIRYGPEVGNGDLPWDSVKDLAGAIRQVKRKDLVSTFDRLTHPSSRSKVASYVYGTTHPLDPVKIRSGGGNSTVIVNDLAKIQALRADLPIYDKSKCEASLRTRLNRLARNRNTWAVGAIVGVGAVGLSLYTRSKKR